MRKSLQFKLVSRPWKVTELVLVKACLIVYLLVILFSEFCSSECVSFLFVSFLVDRDCAGTYVHICANVHLCKSGGLVE